MVLGMGLIPYYVIGALAVLAVGFIAGFQFASSNKETRDMELLDDLEGAEGFKMAKHDTDQGALGVVMRERKKKKALSKGMVRWHLVGSAFEAPRYIKPTREEGGNIPEVKHKGETYYFPESSTVPSEEEGVPTVIHRQGESDPINLRDGWDLAVDAKSLSEYLYLKVTSTAPSTGLFGGLGDMSTMEMMRYGLLGVIGLAVLWSIASGGIA